VVSEVRDHEAADHHDDEGNLRSEVSVGHCRRRPASIDRECNEESSASRQDDDHPSLADRQQVEREDHGDREGGHRRHQSRERSSSTEVLRREDEPQDGCCSVSQRS